METLSWIIYFVAAFLLFYGAPILVVVVLIQSIVSSITKNHTTEPSPKDDSN